MLITCKKEYVNQMSADTMKKLRKKKQYFVNNQHSSNIRKKREYFSI